MTEPVIIGINQNKWVKNASTRMINLSRKDDAIGAKNCNEVIGTDYSVPAGKKLTILQIFVAGSSAASYDHANIYASLISDNASGNIIMRYLMSTLQNSHQTMNVNLEFTAGQFVVASHGQSGYIENMIGVECDV
ncbi:MAG: hypothetical protein P8L91_08530 [Candidatus Marinimicrobia bacterium]|nr:hypothetical protein [Candidatus Neomarinimicrobiota bacterium]